jgi:hypothetical protein
MPQNGGQPINYSQNPGMQGNPSYPKQGNPSYSNPGNFSYSNPGMPGMQGNGSPNYRTPQYSNNSPINSVPERRVVRRLPPTSSPNQQTPIKIIEKDPTLIIERSPKSGNFGYKPLGNGY